jgi:DUF4097 and DUF4098 domain-containing protein YvlB
MGRTAVARTAVTLALVAGFAVLGTAQSRQGRRSGCPDWSDRGATVCESRDATIPGSNPLDVDAGPNGGISVKGWDRPEMLVHAIVSAHANTDAEARAILSGVKVDATGNRVRAEGPSTGDNQHWSVTYELSVPRNAYLTLNTRNGGISIEDFRGSAQFHARNGGLSLVDVGGDLRGETTNGGVSVDLTGDHWDGQGLDVETHNGGVKLSLPQGFSAELETGTTNGRFEVDFPMVVQGTFRRGQHLTTTLGSGGPKIRAITTNGGVVVRQR